jgi:hypothetical protein
VKTNPFSDVLGFVTQAGWTTSPEAVLASGDRLVAIAAIPCRLEDLVEKYGDQVRTSPLEVADEDAACAAVQVAGGRVGELGARAAVAKCTAPTCRSCVSRSLGASSNTASIQMTEEELHDRREPDETGNDHGVP